MVKIYKIGNAKNVDKMKNGIKDNKSAYVNQEPIKSRECVNHVLRTRFGMDKNANA